MPVTLKQSNSYPFMHLKIQVAFFPLWCFYSSCFILIWNNKNYIFPSEKHVVCVWFSGIWWLSDSASLGECLQETEASYAVLRTVLNGEVLQAAFIIQQVDLKIELRNSEIPVYWNQFIGQWLQLFHLFYHTIKVSTSWFFLAQKT